MSREVKQCGTKDGLSGIDPPETAHQPQGCRLLLGATIKEAMMNYQFNINLAVQYGVEEAVMLQNIIFWLRKNKTNETNFHDGRTWTYNSASSFEELFPFWNARKIARILKNLEEKGVLVSGNYNATKYDRTKWYALVDESNLELPFDKMENGKTGSVRPIPDSNTDSKTNGNTYVAGEPARVAPAPVKDSSILKQKSAQRKNSVPCREDVIAFAKQCAGNSNPAPYVEKAIKAYDFYTGNMEALSARTWKDGNGNTVKNWKLKIRNNWFSDITAKSRNEAQNIPTL